MEKWSCKNPLKLKERQVIQEGIESGLSSRQIALLINRAKSTILRESKRLGELEDYEAEKAQSHFESTQRQGWEKQKMRFKKNHS